MYRACFIHDAKMHRYTFKYIFYSFIAIQSATSTELSNEDKIIIETAKSHGDICEYGATSNGGASINRQIEITETGSYIQDGTFANETYAQKDVKNYGNFTVISEKCSEFKARKGRTIGGTKGGKSLAIFEIVANFSNYKNTYIKKLGELIVGPNAQYINKCETTVTDYAKIKINGGKYINTGKQNIIGNEPLEDAGYAGIYAEKNSNIENDGTFKFQKAKFQLNNSNVTEKGTTLFDKDSILRLSYSSYELSKDACVTFKDNAQISCFGSQITVKDNATMDFSGLKTGKIYNYEKEVPYINYRTKPTKNNQITFKDNTKILIPHISFKDTNKNILNIKKSKSYEVMQPTSLIIPKYILNKAQTTIHEANQKEDIKQKLIETITNEFKITLNAQIQDITFEQKIEEPIKKSNEGEDEVCTLKLTKEVFEKAKVTPEKANEELNKQKLLETINNEYKYDKLTVDDKKLKIKFELYEDKECYFVRSETIKKFQPTLEGTVRVGLPRSIFDVAQLTVEQANSSQENKTKLFKTIEKETSIEFLGDTCKAKFEQYDSKTEECVDYWSNEECD